MTNQVQGELLFACNEAYSFYTPWLPVRGDRATFGVEVIAITANCDLKWSVQTREREDPGSYGDPVAPQLESSPGVSTMLSSSAASNLCKELVRYKLTTAGATSTSEFVVFRVLQPSWQVDR